MPFIPAALVGPLIGAGASVGSTILGSKMAGGPSSQQMTQALNSQQEAIKQGQEIATGLQPQAQNLLGLSSNSFSPVANYYGGILGGGRTAALDTLAPEAQRIAQGYGNALSTTANLMPRGGGRSAFFAEQPFAQQRDIQGLLQGARPAAAQGLLSTATATGNQGNSIYSNIFNALNGNRSSAAGLLGAQSQAFNQGKDIGSGIFELFKQVPMLSNLFSPSSSLSKVQGGNVPQIPLKNASTFPLGINLPGGPS